jgi:hypothetical protein
MTNERQSWRKAFEMIGPEQLSNIAETNFHQITLGRRKSGCLKKLPKPPSSNVNAFGHFSYGRSMLALLVC